MQIALRVITGILVSISTSIIGAILYPILLKREQANEEKAKAENSVYVSKKFGATFVCLLVFLNIIGILIIALPNVITEILGFNYVATICIWWIPIIFDDIVTYLLFTKTTYDDVKITVKKLFRKPKIYYFNDITYYTRTGNLKVVTSNGSFMLFNMLAGTNGLRQLIAQKTSQA